MSLKRPPSTPDEKKIEEIVNKGGKVAEESKIAEEKQKIKWTIISVRLPEWMLKHVDDAIEKRPGLSRNAWILESFMKSLREQND